MNIKIVVVPVPFLKLHQATLLIKSAVSAFLFPKSFNTLQIERFSTSSATMKFLQILCFVFFTVLSVNGMVIPLTHHVNYESIAARDFGYNNLHQAYQHAVLPSQEQLKGYCTGGCATASYLCLKLCNGRSELELLKCAQHCQDLFNRCTKLC